MGESVRERGKGAYVYCTHTGTHTITHTHTQCHTHTHTQAGREGRRKGMGEGRGGNKGDGVSLLGVGGDVCTYVEYIYIG